MSSHTAYRLAASCVIAAAMLATPVTSVSASPNAGGVSADRARVTETLKRVQVAEQRAAEARYRLSEASKELDSIVLAQERTRDQLSTRVSFMYRAGQLNFLYVLLGADSFQEFVSRWALLTRMNHSDAEALTRLDALRRRAKKSTDELVKLQESAATSADEAQRELVDARKKLAQDESALAELRRRAAPKVRSAKRPPFSNVKPQESQLQGTGPWKTAVASHYGRDFTGRGASGSRIGPYSMICAHKTLPFGTLVEFEWRGQRAVASVQDRGPHTPGRDFDLGPGIVRVLDFEGVQQVRYRVIDR